MNSRKNSIAVLLFLVACATSETRADEQGNDCLHIRQMHEYWDKYVACLTMRDTYHSKKRTHIKDGDQEYCRELNRTLLEEIEKSGTAQQKTHEQDVDLLEKLLETTPTFPHPDRCR